jgi:hypothetical protein
VEGRTGYSNAANLALFEKQPASGASAARLFSEAEPDYIDKRRNRSCETADYCRDLNPVRQSDRCDDRSVMPEQLVGFIVDAEPIKLILGDRLFRHCRLRICPTSAPDQEGSVRLEPP